MNDHLLPTKAGAMGRAACQVVPVVVSRPSSDQPNRRSLAVIRLWREGTDPAQRGRKGRRPMMPVIGGAA